MLTGMVEKKKLLITGFEPFGGEKINPSWEAVRLLPDIIGNCELTKLEIPVVFSLAGEKTVELAEKLHPDAVMCVGQYGGADSVRIEMAALNLRNGKDSGGNIFSDAPVVSGGPAAYFATLPVRKMESAVKDGGIPVRVSFSAGTYVCNDVFYYVSHHFDNTGTAVGFIHVPYIPCQTKTAPTMELQTIVCALKCAISALY